MDHVLFWTARDLERKLVLFKEYYKERTHTSLGGVTPREKAEDIAHGRSISRSIVGGLSAEDSFDFQELERIARDIKASRY